jgi:hypothetical protein
MNKVILRHDLALEELSIPAYDDVEEPDTGINLTYLNEDDLKGAFLIGDNDDDTRPHYLFEHIQLNDGRKFYVHGIDLDYLNEEGQIL